MELEITQAPLNCSSEFAKYVMMTGERFLKAAFGKNVQKMLESLFVRKNNLFSYECTRFAVADGKIVGAVVFYPYEYYIKARWNTGFLIVKNILFTKIFGLIKIDRGLGKHKKDEVYLSHLAVDPSYRGMGIGHRLLEHVVEEAERLKKKKVVLHVESDNVKAIGLYKSFGFLTEKTAKIKVSGQNFEFLKMVKYI
ncbi:GNAT family N-acetyltransferase [Pseudothermotoga thermarum]|uniref:GCN5-related N-acetyltransferase n=1 Tax=Pseudothermotoga thermarum DSM 5069 TaxID=688269 RepID=F7YUL7_9THEM|nr:N-acetyltransferase [Pseudothermotoga thermarum]AEH51492.1 GCN5-related N-acetyltransferase [Pseudothermotoga thermarum DSM 5069]